MLETADLDRVRPVLAAADAERVWVSPPLIVVSAALIHLVTAELTDGPWEVSDDLWAEYLPVARPSGSSTWRKTSYALQATGCLAGGLWLDVGTVESFWSAPLWPRALAVVELLAVIARTRLQAAPTVLAERLTDALAPTLHTPA